MTYKGCDDVIIRVVIEPSILLPHTDQYDICSYFQRAYTIQFRIQRVIKPFQLITPVYVKIYIAIGRSLYVHIWFRFIMMCYVHTYLFTSSFECLGRALQKKRQNVDDKNMFICETSLQNSPLVGNL